MITLAYPIFFLNKFLFCQSRFLLITTTGRGVWGRMDSCICMAESPCCPPEITTTLLTGSNISGLVAKSCPTLMIPWNVAHQAPPFMGFSKQECCHFLLQGIFPTQESNSSLLHCRQILYRLSYQGSQYKIKSLKKKKTNNFFHMVLWDDSEEKLKTG